MSAEITETASGVLVGKVQSLFHINRAPNPGWVYDVSRDGKKFVVVTQVGQQGAQPLTPVVNWPALLKER